MPEDVLSPQHVHNMYTSDMYKVALEGIVSCLRHCKLSEANTAVFTFPGYRYLVSITF